MERHRTPRWLAAAAIAVVVLGMFVIYVISSGPAFVLMINGQISEGCFNAIYAPLLWVSRHSESVKLMLAGYWAWCHG